MSVLMKLSTEARVSTGKDIVSSRLADEIVILDLKSGVYHGLEAVGARIWELVGDATPVHEIRDTLLDEYEVAADRCEEDLFSLIADLESHGLVQISDQSGA
jgi:hypothetical protein